MTLDEIKAAVDEGKIVKWVNNAYQVIKDNLGQYLIICHLNNSCIGLHGLKGTKYENVLNGREDGFYIDPQSE